MDEPVGQGPEHEPVDEGFEHGPPPEPPPGAATPRQGMSTGAKVLFGCLGVSLLGIVVIGVIAVMGGLALKRGVDSAVGTMEQQQEATDALQRIEEAHPFVPPDDGVVTERQLERYVAVTERAWEDMRPWAEDLQDLRDDADGEATGMAALREMATGARALGGLARSRVALAEALEAEEISLGEYLWTGIQLSRAEDARTGGRPSEAVPEGNRVLVERHADDLSRLVGDGGQDGDQSVVLAVATLWGMSDLSTWRALGLDTLVAETPRR
jgi:hypothetical protein